MKGKNTVEAKSWLDEEFPGSAPGKSTIIDWYTKFKSSEMSTEDGKHSGRPKEAVTDEKIKVHKIILNDRAGKKFSANEEVIAETEAYFEDKSYYKNIIKKLEDSYNRCIALEGNYIE